MNNENILAQMGLLKMGGMQEAFREQQSHPKHAKDRERNNFPFLVNQ